MNEEKENRDSSGWCSKAHSRLGFKTRLRTTNIPRIKYATIESYKYAHRMFLGLHVSVSIYLYTYLYIGKRDDLSSKEKGKNKEGLKTNKN